jgi:hypothetical protein
MLQCGQVAELPTSAQKHNPQIYDTDKAMRTQQTRIAVLLKKDI